MRRGHHLGKLAILSVTHCATDCYAAFPITLWLVLEDRFRLQPLQTGFLISAALFPANILQPIYGLISDRFNARWLVVAGPLMAALCLSLVGLSHWLPLTMAMIFLGMMGVGSFHPDAATMAGRFGATGSTRTMAIFLGGGYIGYAIGPTFISWAITGPERTFSDSWVTIFPGLAVVAIMALAVGRLPHTPVSHKLNKQQSWRRSLAGRHTSVWCLFGTHTARVFGLNIIMCTLPLYLKARNLGQMEVGHWITVFAAGQGIGILAGGLTAPAHRERLLLIVSMIAALVPVVMLPFVEDLSAKFFLNALPPFAKDWPTLAILGAAGMCIAWSIPATIRLGQDIVPGSQRWVSGLLIGFSWGLGAITAPTLVGFVCQKVSPRGSLMMAAIMLVVAVCFAISMPRQAHLNELKRDVGGE